MTIIFQTTVKVTVGRGKKSKTRKPIKKTPNQPTNKNQKKNPYTQKTQQPTNKKLPKHNQNLNTWKYWTHQPLGQRESRRAREESQELLSLVLTSSNHIQTLYFGGVFIQVTARKNYSLTTDPGNFSMLNSSGSLGLSPSFNAQAGLPAKSSLKVWETQASACLCITAEMKRG